MPIIIFFIFFIFKSPILQAQESSLSIAQNHNSQIPTVLDDQRIYMHINGIPILHKDFQIYYDNFKKNITLTPENIPLFRKSIEDIFIEKTLKTQITKNANVVLSPEEIEENLVKIAQHNKVSRQALGDFFQAQDLHPSIAFERIQLDLLWEKYTFTHWGPRLRITNAEIEATQGILKKQELSHQTKEYRIAEIFIPKQAFNPNTSSLLEHIQQQFQEGIPFKTLVQNFSFSPTALHGGELPWTTQDLFPKELQDTIVTLQKGSISPPITTEKGTYILHLMDIRFPHLSFVQLFHSPYSLKKYKTSLDATQKKISQLSNCDEFTTFAESFGGPGSTKISNISSANVHENIVKLLINTPVNTTSQWISFSGGHMLVIPCPVEIAFSAKDIRSELLTRKVLLKAQTVYRKALENALIQITAP